MKIRSIFLALTFIVGSISILSCGVSDGPSLSSKSPGVGSGNGGGNNSSSFTVSYDRNGADSGSAPSDSSSPYSSGSSVTVLGNTGSLVKSGNAFLGWNTSADASGTNYTPLATFSMPAANVILYAHWVAGHSVTYNSNGATSGSAPSDTSSPYAVGATVTVLPKGNLSRGGYGFTGWNTKIDGSGDSYNPADTLPMPSSSVTLYAQWTILSTHSVTYEGNGNDSGSVPVDNNDYWQDTPVPVAENSGSLAKAGHTFAGWEIVLDGSTNAVNETFYMPAANVVLRAQWVPVGLYRVNYNGNGDTGGSVPVDAGSPAPSGSTITIMGNPGNLVRGGDTFLGWNTSANGTGTNYAPGDTFSITSHTVLYARWTPNYTVSFNANGGTGSMSPKAIAGGTSARLPSNAFTRANYVFAGWATSANGPLVYNNQQSYAMGSANTTLYAKWVEQSSLKVNYNFNNQDAQDSSGNGNNGTANNVTYVPDGSGNYAVKTNGTSSYVSLPNSLVVNNPNFTIMMRFKASPSQHGSLFGYQNRPAGDNAANQHVPMIVVRSDGRLRGELWTTSNYQLEVISSKAVNDGQWHTVYFSGDGNTIKLFLDGVLLSQASDSVNHLTMIYNQIGVSRAAGRTLMPNPSPTPNNWYYFNGLIDDFFFYDTAL